MKRAFDVFAALLGLIVFWPIIATAMIAIRLTSPGPCLFAQPRIGRRARQFTCYKLRTMHKGTPQLPTHEVASSVVTPLGSFLRRRKLDELPQLVNVLRGEMSIVGPRPCLPSQTRLIKARWRQGALDVLPGITGLAQVQGIDMTDTARLAKIDGLYVRTRSFSGDLWIIIQTLAGGGMNVDLVRRSDRLHSRSESTKP